MTMLLAQFFHIVVLTLPGLEPMMTKVLMSIDLYRMEMWYQLSCRMGPTCVLCVVQQRQWWPVCGPLCQYLCIYLWSLRIDKQNQSSKMNYDLVEYSMIETRLMVKSMFTENVTENVWKHFLAPLLFILFVIQFMRSVLTTGTKTAKVCVWFVKFVIEAKLVLWVWPLLSQVRN